MSKENGNIHIATTSKLDAIKDIIFGQTMQEYDERFSNLDVLLHKKLKDQEKLAESRLKTLQKDFDEYKIESEQKLLSLEKKFMKKLDALSESKADKKVLKKHLINLIENL